MHLNQMTNPSSSNKYFEDCIGEKELSLTNKVTRRNWALQHRSHEAKEQVKEEERNSQHRHLRRLCCILLYVMAVLVVHLNVVFQSFSSRSAIFQVVYRKEKERRQTMLGIPRVLL